MDARVLTRKLLRDYTDGDDTLKNNNDFDEQMIDYLQYGMESIEGLIALFYKNLWDMADLYEKLKEYEDLGLTPGQIKKIDILYKEKCEQINILKKCRRH